MNFSYNIIKIIIFLDNHTLKIINIHINIYIHSNYIMIRIFIFYFLSRADANAMSRFEGFDMIH